MRCRWKSPSNNFFVSVSIVLLAYLWLESPSQKVPRLVWELKNRPGGHIDILWIGRPDSWIQADFDRLGKRAVPALIKILERNDLTGQYLAAGQLGRLGDQRAVEPLIAVLNLGDSVTSKWAMAALGDIGDNRAVDHLIPLLKGENRWIAAEALGKIGDKRAYESIVPLVRDSDVYARAHAVEAIGCLGNEKAVDLLHEILRTERDEWVRGMAMNSLQELKDRGMITEK